DRIEEAPDGGDASRDARADGASAAADAAPDVGPIEDAGDGSDGGGNAGDADASDASNLDAASDGDAADATSDADAGPLADSGDGDANDAAFPLDAGDGATLTTAALIQLYESADCLSCAQGHCLTPGQGYLCEELEGGATAGPATGVSRTDLCLLTFQCLASSDCPSSGDLSVCFCGSTNATSCRTGTAQPAGACVVQERAGLE